MPGIYAYGKQTFDFDREVAVMAIVNRTPDSFYDRGATYALGAALDRVDQALDEGARWLDIGGIKAGPGPEVDEQADDFIYQPREVWAQEEPETFSDEAAEQEDEPAGTRSRGTRCRGAAIDRSTRPMNVKPGTNPSM